ncbi:MAG: asparaginase [Candidatus Eisenbacteria bacterium]|nr:asparaginase [Candidatus Eisenbacteria bacterium]
MQGHRHIAILSTGGTIEKTFNESDGTLANQRSVLEIMLASLVLHGVHIDRIPVMNLDSADMEETDQERIVKVAAAYSESHDGLIITHGTDRLARTGEILVERLGASPRVPIVLTGAMRPYELRTSDALQNLTEALLAVQVLAPGVYVVMHNTALRFPGVVKDHKRMTFRRTEAGESRQTP